MKNIADNKRVKLGETSIEAIPSQAVTTEGVETRRHVCIRCGGSLLNRRIKYCSDRCAHTVISYNWRVTHGIIKNPGVGKGNAQGFWKKHHSYETGIKNFSKKGFEYYGRKCGECGSLENLLVHHKNHNRQDNSIKNLVVLCKGCHQEIHCRRDPETGRYIKG